jgi:hypothetical protein
VVYKDTRELRWICHKHFAQGLCVGELGAFPCLWDELREGKNVILDVACESAMDLMGTREREDVVQRGLQGVDEIGGAHQDQSTSSSSSSSILGSYLKPRSNNQHMTIYTPSDLLMGTNKLQGEIQELDRSPQHEDKPVGELGCEIQQGKHLAIKEQLRRNSMSKELHRKELEMAKPTSARVNIYNSSPLP